MSISQRIEGTIENWRVKWGNTLKGWMAGWFEWGFEKLFDAFEPGVREEITPQLNQLKAIPNLPAEWKNVLEKATTQPSFIQFAALVPYLIGAMFGLAMGTIAPIGNWGRYFIDRFVRSARLDPLTATRAYWRGFLTKERLMSSLKDQGWSDEDITTILEVTHYYPSPLELVNWQAKEVFEPKMIAKYGLKDEVEELEREAFYKAGMTDEQIDNFWMAHWRAPSFKEITDMLHRGELTPEDVYSWYRLVEISPYWREKLTSISWDLPNRIELRMMARYGLVDKAFLVKQLEMVGLREDFRDVAADMMLSMGIRTDLSTRYSKGWINAEEVKQELVDSGLSETVQTRMYRWIVKNIQTDRVINERDLTKTDLYRGVKKGILARSEAQGLLQEMGYDEAEAKFILDLNAPAEETTKEVKQRELTKADVLKAYKLNVIDLAETISRLILIRFTAEDATFLTDLVDITKEVIPDERQRELTKIDIVKGVKAGVITSEEGYIMLQDIGYSPADSQFILTVRVEAVAGSPTTFKEYEKLVQTYRASLGLPSIVIPEELIQAERDYKAAQAALDSAKVRKVKPKRLLELEGAVEDAKIAYHQLLQK